MKNGSDWYHTCDDPFDVFHFAFTAVIIHILRGQCERIMTQPSGLIYVNHMIYGWTKNEYTLPWITIYIFWLGKRFNIFELLCINDFLCICFSDGTFIHFDACIFENGIHVYSLQICIPPAGEEILGKLSSELEYGEMFYIYIYIKFTFFYDSK